VTCTLDIHQAELHIIVVSDACFAPITASCLPFCTISAGRLGHGKLHHPPGRGLHRDRGGVGPRGSAVVRLGQVSTWLPCLPRCDRCTAPLASAPAGVWHTSGHLTPTTSHHRSRTATASAQVHCGDTHHGQALDADDVLRGDDRGRCGCVQAVRLLLQRPKQQQVLEQQASTASEASYVFCQGPVSSSVACQSRCFACSAGPAASGRQRFGPSPACHGAVSCATVLAGLSGWTTCWGTWCGCGPMAAS
jgi:hypothetical protein